LNHPKLKIKSFECAEKTEVVQIDQTKYELTRREEEEEEDGS